MERILVGLTTPARDDPTSLLLLDLLTGATLQSFTDGECRANSVAVFGTSSPNVINLMCPNYIAVAHAHKALLCVYRRDAPAPFWRAAVPEILSAAVVHPLGHFIFGGGGSGSLYVWHGPTGNLMRNFTPHARGVTCLAFSNDCSLLFSVGEEGGVYAYRCHELVDVSETSPKPMTRWVGHTAPIVGVVSSLSPVGGILGGWVITAARDRTLYVWSFESSEKIGSLLLPSEPTCLSIDPNGLWVYVGCVDGRIITVDLRSLVERPNSDISTSNDFFGHEGPVKCLAVNWDGSLVISAANDGLRVWDTQSRRTFRHYLEKGTVSVASLNFFVDCPNLMPLTVPSWRPLSRNLVKPHDVGEIIVVSHDRQRRLQNAYQRLIREEVESNAILEELSGPLTEAVEASARERQLVEAKTNTKKLAKLASDIFGHLLKKAATDADAPQANGSFLSSVLGLGDPTAMAIEGSDDNCHPSQQVVNAFAMEPQEQASRYAYAERNSLGRLLKREDEQEKNVHFVIEEATPTSPCSPTVVDLSAQSLRLIRPM